MTLSMQGGLVVQVHSVELRRNTCICAILACHAPYKRNCMRASSWSALHPISSPPTNMVQCKEVLLNNICSQEDAKHQIHAQMLISTSFLVPHYYERMTKENFTHYLNFSCCQEIKGTGGSMQEPSVGWTLTSSWTGKSVLRPWSQRLFF